MNWIAPKVDWTANDHFNVDPDYIRITNNLLYIKELSVDAYGEIDFSNMENATIRTIPLIDFFNQIEHNTQKIFDETYRSPEFIPGKIYDFGDFAWDYSDLNRLESNMLIFYNALNSQYYGMQILSFELGGMQF